LRTLARLTRNFSGDTLTMIALIAAALILIFLPALVLFYQARFRLREHRRQLRDAIEEAEQIHADMVAQSGLEQNIGLLRAKLYALGRPRRDGDELYFGGTLIGGDCAVVDDVKMQCGGVATIFVADRRVATNVLNPDGSRAVGTRLGRGLAYERVLGAGLSYHGEAEIFGQGYLAIYEPILADGEVAGIIFAGVRKTPAAAAAPRDEMTVSVTALKAVLQAQAETLHRSLAARQEAEDRRRMREHAAA